MNNIYTPKVIPTYFEWLKNTVDPFVGRGTHECFFNALHSMAYVPIMELDRNREMDGLGLRDVYIRGYGIDSSDSDLVVDSPCSVLEFLVSLANKMDYIYSPTETRHLSALFWEIMGNIGLDYSSTTDSDAQKDPSMFHDRIQSAIDMVQNRTYQPDGTGNLFPLKNPKEDQRNVEVWYQMNQYLIEKMGI